MKRWTNSIILLFIFSFIQIISIVGQSRADLENDRNNIILQIEIAEEQIQEAEKSTKASTKKLSAIKSKIAAREKLISNLKDQLNLSLDILQANGDSLAVMDSNLVKLKRSYNNTMKYAYVRQTSASKWINIFSAKSLNEGILLWKYASQFESFINNKRQKLLGLKEAINNANQSILEEKEYTDNLLLEEKKNFELLADAKNDAAKIVSNLKGKESELRSNIAIKKKEREKLNRKIEGIILAELAKRNKVAKPSTSSVTKKKSIMWPVKNGYISAKFGKQAHPTITNLTINNNGVDISSKANSSVYCVMDGTVVGVTNIPGYDTMVIIEHGENYTVYSKLSSSLIAKGDSVSLNQKIGTLGKSGILHFELWKGQKKLNPKDWLQKK